MGQWDASQTRIVSSLENMTQANGLPYNVNATDTWWQVNPGQGLTVPNPSIIRSFQDSKAYREELIRRGLLQPTEMTPPLSVDSGLKEVLHLQKEAYNSVERLQISRIAREMGLAREVVPGQETQMLQEIALRHAKQQQGVDAGKARLEQWGLSNEDLNQHIYRIAQQYGVDSGIHSGSHPELLEKILMRESASRNQNGIPSFSKLFVDSLEAIRMATRHGRFKTEIEKVKDVAITKEIGGSNRELKVILDKDKMAENGVDALGIMQMIQANNGSSQSGAFVENDQEYLLKTGQFLENADDVENLVVGKSYVRIIDSFTDAVPSAIIGVLDGNPAQPKTDSVLTGTTVMRLTESVAQFTGIQFVDNEILPTRPDTDLRLSADGGGQIVLAAPLLFEDSTVPRPDIGQTGIYVANPGGGGTGVYFVSSSTLGIITSDEFVSRKKALIYSLIF
jgi:hypothetical protein